MDDVLRRLPGALLPWYRANARDLPWRRTREPYPILVSEIMLQQTRAEVVKGYYLRFLAALPTVEALAAADERELLKLWEGLGYYSRARNLQKAARVIAAQYGGVFPREPEALRALPGVGPYTAGAVASVCFDAPAAAVDGNVLRVVSRLEEYPEPADAPAARTLFTKRLSAVYPDTERGAFTQALMELGATVCLPRAPRCAACPAADFCGARAHGTQSRYPIRLPKREKTTEERTVLLLRYGDEIALTRRTEPGLLSGMWQLPNAAGRRTAGEAVRLAEELGVRPETVLWERRREHVFTHIRWQMVCYCIRCGAQPAELTWADPESVRTDYPIPTAFRIFLDGV